MLLKLAENLGESNKSERVQVAKVGTFNHDLYGKFSITPLDLARMKENFEADARRQKIDDNPVLPFDYKHEEEDKAAGWILKLSIDKDANQVESLFAAVEWTPEGADKVRGKEFKFVSPSIQRGYVDSETGDKYDIVLKGATLTNVPFLRGMEAVYLLSESRQAAYLSLKLSGDNSPDVNKLQTGGKMQTIDELLGMLTSMSPEDKKALFEALAKEFESTMMAEKDKAVEEKDKAVELQQLAEKKVEDLTLKLTESSSDKDKQVLELSEKVSSLTKKIGENEAEAAKDKKTAAFNLMLSEGKACEAQRDAFMSGDVEEFAAKAEPIKLSEGGNAANDSETDVQAKVIKLAEKKIKDSKESGETIDFGKAVSMVLSENADLRKSYESGN